MVSEWQELEEDLDCVVNLAPGTYTNSKNFELHLRTIPKRRIVLMGDVDEMEVVASGTTTAGDATSITDAGASFGILNEQVGLLLRVYDPANRTATEKRITIRSHTGTVVNPTIPFTAIVGGTAAAAGWTYQILRPSVILAAHVDSSVDVPVLALKSQWRTPVDLREQRANTGPCIVLAYMGMQSDKAGAPLALSIKGGQVSLLGITTGGTGRVEFMNTAVFTGLDASNVADPVFDLGAGDVKKVIAAGWGQLNAAAATVTVVNVNQARFFGEVASKGGQIVVTQFSQWVMDGGAAYGGGFRASFQSVLNLNAFSASLPIIVRNGGTAGGVTAGIRVDRGSTSELRRIDFQTPVSGDAILVEEAAYLRIIDSIAAAGVTGWGLNVQHGGQCRAASTVTYTGVLGEIQADAVSETWANLVVGTPVIGANSGARVWEG